MISGQYPNTFYRVAVKALIKNDKGQILMVKENSDTWDLPGGGLDHGEEPLEGVKRELLEELGVNDVTIGKPMLVKTFWLEHKQAWLMWIVYDVELHNDHFSFGEGVTAIEYLDPATLSQSDDERERFISSLVNL